MSSKVDEATEPLLQEQENLPEEGELQIEKQKKAEDSGDRKEIKEEDILIEQEGLETSFYSEEPGEKLYLIGHKSESKNTEEKEICCPNINRQYLVPKAFFFFFYASIGVLMPYLTLFFKQLQLTAGQVGVVAGMKPYIAFIFIPIWGYIADKTKKAKWIYVLAMVTFATGYFMFSLAPAEHVCRAKSNSTKHQMEMPMVGHDHGKRSEDPRVKVSMGLNEMRSIGRSQKRSYPTNSSYSPHNDISRRNDNTVPWIIDVATSKGDPEIEANFKEKDDVHVDIHSIFVYLLLVSIIKTIFSCPALTIVDTITVQMLKDNGEAHKYGMQRLWGSIGWGATAFGVGTILSTLPLCPGTNDEVNYYPAFYIFTALMLIAFVIGLRLDFDGKKENKDKQTKKNNISEGLKLMKKPHFIYFMITAFYVGVAMAVIRTFLFWHLKDLGGTQLLFSIISAVNCLAEVFMYFLSAWFINSIGHIGVLYVGLLCYAVRLLFYSMVVNPWYVLFVEPLSGITTAAVWAAMASYVGVNSVDGSATTVQG
eukprot:Seg1190.13 transcript_id=Seg1190.13/GoldUCD/mRNA.D3Y31 product="Major facilitator superfamily domain-containing protein 6" protein_id=Seg1190.13/GoldUCD/D3Y31